MRDRVIGKYEGSLHGPLIIVFGAMHGNESAGVKALELVFKMLEVEPITNPEFTFKGNLIGLIGNLSAFDKSMRFIDKDLNRSWDKSEIDKIEKSNERTAEGIEIIEILAFVKAAIKTYKPSNLYVLDLHTTSSYGGIFSIVSDDPRSTQIARAFHAPVIKGLLTTIKGTTLHYFNKENMLVDTVAITFESGQHEDPLSIKRAVSAIINCLRATESVASHHVENIHDQILIEHSKGLPDVVELLYKYSITPDEGFKMKPGYKNFQRVSKGEVLAENVIGNIEAKNDAMILMPLYQEQGEDGFFIVE